VFEESKRSLAFVAERVLCSLANALHRFKNLPAPGQPLPAEVRHEFLVVFVRMRVCDWHDLTLFFFTS